MYKLKNKVFCCFHEKIFSCLSKGVQPYLPTISHMLCIPLHDVQTVIGVVCIWMYLYLNTRLCQRLCVHVLVRSCTLCLRLKRQQFPMVSVLRLFRGLGLRGVQIPAARFLGEKGFLWYAPDQQWDARDPAPQGNHWPDWSGEYRANCPDKNITYLK